MLSETFAVRCLYCLVELRSREKPKRNATQHLDYTVYHFVEEYDTSLAGEDHRMYQDPMGWYKDCPAGGMGLRGMLGDYVYPVRLLDSIVSGKYDLFRDPTA